ncbi:hypothetical protein [Microcoleus vaginatus]|uniref:hypothetical protein n=1 Tax=Microcoleus vaginatus TaxID=119532 RepID=UPI001F6049E5
MPVQDWLFGKCLLFSDCSAVVSLSYAETVARSLSFGEHPDFIQTVFSEWELNIWREDIYRFGYAGTIACKISFGCHRI